MRTPEIVDAIALAERGAALVVEAILAGMKAEPDGVFSLILSGGKTPEALYRKLAEPPHRDRIPWRDVLILWGDERCVLPGDPESNYRMAREALLDRVALPARNIHRIKGEIEPAAAAAAYEETLKRRLAPSGGLPRFDLVLLGLGEDGHTASLFPGSPALKERERFVVATVGPKSPPDRITLTLPILNAARRVVFLVSGEGKRDALKKVLAGDKSLPAALVRPADGSLLYLVDRAAAGT